jgi:hypothetical protein
MIFNKGEFHEISPACAKASAGRPCPSLPKRGIIPPFGKGRLGGILQMDLFIILRLLIRIKRQGGFFSHVSS